MKDEGQRMEGKESRRKGGGLRLKEEGLPLAISL
jgi:hypothetical protein